MNQSQLHRPYIDDVPRFHQDVTTIQRTFVLYDTIPPLAVWATVKIQRVVILTSYSPSYASVLPIIR